MRNQPLRSCEGFNLFPSLGCGQSVTRLVWGKRVCVFVAMRLIYSPETSILSATAFNPSSSLSDSESKETFVQASFRGREVTGKVIHLSKDMTGIVLVGYVGWN